MGRKITDKVTWVGKTDWELTSFHGDELSTTRGSSYNSYLIQDEKTALIDTAWKPFDAEFVAHLEEVVDLSRIDYIVMDHSEIDHSGALPELMRHIPDTPIYCTAKGEGIIRGHFNEAARDWNFVNVKTGDTLSLGETTITFIEAPMLHWPDTMFSYLSGENILFSTDAFGQHLASEALYDDEVDQGQLFFEAEKYYANILGLYSKQVALKIDELLAMNLPISLICPSHGMIWRSGIERIIDTYRTWAGDYQLDQVTIIYDTMWNSTRVMAEAIAAGIVDADPAVTVKLFNAAHKDKNDIVTEVFHSKAILVGSPTVNYGFTYAIAGILEMIEGMHLKGRKAAAFGSYGWSGNAPQLISEKLSKSGFQIVDDGCKTLWVPDDGEISRIREWGRCFARTLMPESAQEDGAGVQAEPAPKRYICNICGYAYDPATGDPDSGIEPGTPFEDIPDDWRCPICGAGKADFTEAD